MHFQLNDMATFDFTADIGNQDAVDPKLPETNTNDVEKITDDTSNMANEFDGTSDQDTVTQKLSNTTTSQSEKLDCLVGNIKHNQQEDLVIQKLPETDMAPTPSTSAAPEVGL